MTKADNDNEVPPLPRAVAKAFKGREWIGLRELKDAIGIHLQTLRRYAKQGVLLTQQRGGGDKRIHRDVELSAVKQFWREIHGEVRRGPGRAIGRKWRPAAQRNADPAIRAARRKRRMNSPGPP